MSTATAVLDPDTTPTHAPAPTDLVPPEAPDFPEPDTELDTTELPAVEALWVRPDQLVIAENVRKTFDLAEFTELRDSITEFGVQTPIRVHRRDKDTFWVLEGQLRTLIAAEVGTRFVPVWVIEPDTGVDENERRIATTLMQMNTNDRRVAMVEVDRADGIALMLDLGASVTRIAKGLQRKRSEVKQIAAIAPSPTARGLVDANTYSLDQLAVIGEYESLGDTDAVERLLAVPRSRFGYLATRIAADRHETRARLEAAALYAGLGFGVLTEEPDTSGDEPAFHPAELLETSDGEPVTETLIAADAPRWVVYIDIEENGQLIDTTTREIVDPDTVDWDTTDNHAADPGQGLRHASTVEYRDQWVPAYYLPSDQLPDSGFTVRPPAPGRTGDRAEAVRLTAEQVTAEREQARRERRIVRELNKRGAAAKQRREEFLTRLLARRTPPAQAAGFVAEALAHDPDLLSAFHGPRTTLSLLGISGFTSELVASIQSATASRAWVIVLAMVLGAFESRTGKDAWRFRDRGIQRYLRFLAAVGEAMEFELVDVEQAAAGLVDFHDIEIDAAA
ncbi:ParB/RepB/Spo0J family partition protein [Nocardia sp. NPDC059246]|uniref:ParB/RepB/Spo0J family partition protein n=1 Tax=unclassified Nocardia TaxID=2637762 RepID=UPI0036A258F7